MNAEKKVERVLEDGETGAIRATRSSCSVPHSCFNVFDRFSAGCHVGGDFHNGYLSERSLSDGRSGRRA